jgi:fibronectin-binding autotransporter adhesin
MSGTGTTYPGSTSGIFDSANFGGDPVGGYAVTIGSTSTVYINTLNFTQTDTTAGNSYTISGGTINLGGTTPTINVATAGVSATIGSVLTGAAGLKLTGAGTLVLTGADSYTGGTSVAAGALTFSGAGAATGAGTLGVASSSGNAVVNLSSTATTMSFGAVTIGSGTGSGAVNQTSGTVAFNPGGGYVEIGDNTGATNTSYGSYVMSGGTLNVNGTSGIRVGDGGVGVFTQTGGTLSVSRYFAIASNTGTASVGVATFTGGTTSLTSSSYYFIIGNTTNGVGVLNLGAEAGGSATITNISGSGFQVTNSGDTAGSGTLNLNGGTLDQTAGSILKGGGSGATATVNFNGGTLLAGANNLTLINNTLNKVNVYNGGAIFNTGTNTATVTANLLGTVGNGIYANGGGGVLAISSGSGGSGYIGAPSVSVSGGSGTGAMAIADVSSGVITGVTLTNPGQNYQVGDIMNFAFSGGGFSTAAPTFQYTLTSNDIAANTTGGVTKLGTGTLKLSGTDSYTGTTIVSAGTLQLGANGALPSTTTLTLGSGTTTAGTFDLNGLTATVAGLATGNSGSASVNLIGNSSTTANGTLIFAGGATASTFGGTIEDKLGSGSMTTALTISSGTLTLSGSNTYSGGTTVSGGQLNFGAATAIGTGNLTLTGGATIDNATTVALILTNNNTQSWNGNFTYAGATQSLNLGAGAVTLGTSVNVTVSNNTLTVGGVIGGGPNGITKLGSGTLALANNNNYSGTTLISAGTLQLTSGTTQASSFTVGNGAVLIVSNLTAITTTTTLPNLTFGQNSTDTETLNLTGASDWSHTTPALLSVGALTTNGAALSTTISVTTSAALSLGTYNLISYAGGSVQGTGSSAFQLAPLSNPRLIASLNDTGSVIQLNVTGSDSPKWTGAMSGVWDINTTSNWQLIHNRTSTTYLQGDSVLFDDTATGTTSITLSTNVTPTAVMFNNNMLTYTLSGSGQISGNTPLTMSGAAITYLQTANSYTGGTFFNAGTISVSSPSNLGTGPLTFNGGALQVTGNTAFVWTTGVTLSGNGGTFDIQNTSGATFSGNITGAGGLTKISAGTLILSGNDNTFGGGTLISAGTLQIGDGTNSGSLPGNVSDNAILAFNPGTSGISVAGNISGSGSVQVLANTVTLSGTNSFNGVTVSGGTLSVGAAANLGSGSVTLGGGSLLFTGSTAYAVASNISLSSTTNTISSNNAAGVTLSGTLSGNALTTGGTGLLVLGAGVVNTYNGTTSITGGTLSVSTIGASATPGNLSTGAALNLSGGGELLYTGVGESASPTISVGTGGGSMINNGGALSFGGGVSGGNTLTVGGSGSTTLTGNITGASTALTVNTAATVIVTGTASSYTGATTVSNGTLTFGGASAVTGGGALAVAAANGNNAVLNLNSSATTMSFGGVTIGNGTGSGAINQASGTVAVNPGGGYVEIGENSGSTNTAYGSYVLSGGTLNVNGTSGIRIGDGGIGVFTQTGGTLNVSRFIAVAAPSGTASVGVATYTGGTTAITNSSYYFIVGNTSDGVGVLNLGTEAGGNATIKNISGSGFQITNSNETSGIGVLNLNSGALNQTAGSILKGGGAGASAVVNFNGGTLQAGANNLTLINNTLTSVNVYNGGAVFNTGTYTATVSANLVGTAGNGIYANGGTGTLTIATEGGSGYIGAPAVNVTGGSGTGAMAIADVTNGVVTGVTLTNPGQNYQVGDTLSFTFAGGGSATAANAFQYTLTANDVAANATGGVSQSGGGTLMLSGANTYTGATNVQNGTLMVGAASALPSTTTVVLGSGTNSGTLDLAGLAPTVAGLVTSGSGAINQVIDSVGGGNLTINYANTSAPNVYNGVLGGGATNNSFGLTVSGPGTVVLGGANTYTGTTTVANGALMVNGNQAAATGNVTVTGTLGGTGTIGGAVTVNSGGLMVSTPLSSATVGTLTVNNSVTISDGGIQGWKISGTTGNPLVPISSATPGGSDVPGAQDLLILTGAGSALTLGSAQGSVLRIVEPGGAGSVILNPNLPYSFTLATTPNQVQFNGTVAFDTSSASFASNAPDFASFANSGGSIAVTASGSNEYLTLTPAAATPEPAMVLLIAAAGLSIVRLIRARCRPRESERRPGGLTSCV